MDITIIEWKNEPRKGPDTGKVLRAHYGVTIQILREWMKPLHVWLDKNKETFSHLSAIELENSLLVIYFFFKVLVEI